MKIICGERVLDLDRMNAVCPDGQHVWVEARPFSYAPEQLPECDAGTYLLTSDRGVVSLRDMAFKILFDMGIWAGARCCRYLARDIARGVRAAGDEWSTVILPDTGTAGELCHELGLRGVYMPCTDRILSCNLQALFARNCDLDEALFGMLSDYIYIDGLSFAGVHDAMSSLLASFGPVDLAEFIEGVYGVVSCDRDEVEARMSEMQADPEGDSESEFDVEAGMDETPAPDLESVSESESEPESDPDGDASNALGIEPGMPADKILERLSGASVKDLRRLSKRPSVPGGSGLFSSGRRLKGSDLTGTSDTYTLGYYAGFYRDAMEKADSTGFADQLIRSRAGYGVAPLAILDEAVNKLRAVVEAQQDGRSPSVSLRNQLLEMADTIAKAAGEIAALPEPVADTSAAIPAGEPDAAVPASEPASEPSEPEPVSDPEPESDSEQLVTDSEPDLEDGNDGPAEPDASSVPEAPSEQLDPEESPEPEYEIPNYGDDYDEFGGAGDDEDGPPDEDDPEPPDEF